jgi:glyoxylase-like metal-dependent hydrolase (beta-lactamase superfamily II)
MLLRFPRVRASLARAAVAIAALAFLLAPVPAGAQTRDIEGNIIPRPRMQFAQDSLISISVHRLAPGVYAAKNRFVWNGWVELPDGILVIDGGYDARSAKALADTIRARSGAKPIRYLLVTSAQTDHMGGVRTFSAMGATVISHARAAPQVRDSLAGRPGGPAPARKALLPVERRLDLGAKGRPVVVEAAPRSACTGGDLYVYLPKQRVLFTGDLVWYKSIPWLVDPAFDRLGWIAALDTLLTKRYAVDSLVPGHGVLGTKSDGLRFTRNYLTEAWELAAKSARWNVPMETIDQWGDLGTYEGMEFYDPVHFVNMRRLYRASKGITTPGRLRSGVLVPKSP